MRKPTVTDDMIRAAMSAMWGKHWTQDDWDCFSHVYRRALEAALKTQINLMSEAKKAYWATKTPEERQAHMQMISAKRRGRKNEA